MTRATCPYCQNPHCPAVGDNEYLCASCGKVFRPGYVTLDTAADALGIPNRTVRNYLRKGKLEGIKEIGHNSKGGGYWEWTWVTEESVNEESVNHLRGDHCPICGLESEGGELCAFCREEKATGKRQWYEINLTPSSSWRAGSLGAWR